MYTLQMSSLKLLVKFDDDSRQTAEVYVEGSVQNETCRFLLDTGCASTTLTRNKFTEQLAEVGKRHSSGTFGRAEYDLVQITSMSVGPIKRENLTVSRAPERGTDRHLLGMDILRDYSLQFDFDINEVRLGAEQSGHGFAHQDIVMDRGLIPHINIEVGGISGNAIWDTGAGITLVDIEFVRRNSELFTPLGDEMGTDSTNTQMKTPIYMMRSMVVAGLKFHPLKIAAVEFSHKDPKIEIRPNFCLGYSTLRQANWFFDFPNRKWAITKMLG